MADPSPWVYGTATLAASSGADSAWTYGPVTLSSSPEPEYTNSAWTYGSVSLKKHRPLGIWDGAEWVRMPIEAWDGSSWH